MIKDNFYSIGNLDPALAVYVVWWMDPSATIRAAFHNVNGDFLLHFNTQAGTGSIGRSMYSDNVVFSQVIRTLQDKFQSTIDSFDYNGGTSFTYDPPGILITSSPLTINDKVFWFEFERKTIAPTGADTYIVDLMRGDSDLTNVSQINTIEVSINSVSEYFPSGHSDIGADFTSLGALVWIEHRDADDTETLYERVYLPYDGSLGQQSGEFQGFDPDRGPRSGYPVGPGRSIVLDTLGPPADIFALNERTLREVKEYNSPTNDPEVLYIPWGVLVPMASDLALNLQNNSIVTVGEGLIREYSLNGVLQNSKTLEEAFAGSIPSGIHKLETPIEI